MTRIPIEDIRAIEAIAARHGWRIEVDQTPARGGGSAVFVGHRFSEPMQQDLDRPAAEVTGMAVHDAAEPAIGQKLSTLSTIEKIPVRWRSVSVPVPADRLGKFVRQPVLNPEEKQVILGFETLQGEVIRLVLSMSEVRQVRDVTIDALDREAGVRKPTLLQLLTGTQSDKSSGRPSVEVSTPEGAETFPPSSSSNACEGEK